MLAAIIWWLLACSDRDSNRFLFATTIKWACDGKDHHVFRLLIVAPLRSIRWGYCRMWGPLSHTNISTQKIKIVISTHTNLHEMKIEDHTRDKTIQMRRFLQRVMTALKPLWLDHLSGLPNVTPGNVLIVCSVIVHIFRRLTYGCLKKKS